MAIVEDYDVQLFGGLFTESQLIESLPHGSGIDCKWTVEVAKNGSVVAYNSFHVMNDVGFYVGYQDFKVKLFRRKTDDIHYLRDGRIQILSHKGDIEVVVQSVGGWRRDRAAYDLREYIWDTVLWSLLDGVLKDQQRKSVIVTAEEYASMPH